MVLDHKESNHSTHRLFILKSAGIIYGFMGSFTLAFAFLFEKLDFFYFPDPILKFPLHISIVFGLLSGFLLALLTTYLTKKLSAKNQYARKLLKEMQVMFTGLKKTDCILLALISAVCEEALFRGLLQPKIGLTWSSLIFGLAHFPRNKIYILWTLEAILLGFAFGFLFMLSGNLIGPVAAHAIINILNMFYLIEKQNNKTCT